MEESVQGPFLEETAGNHIVLNFLQHVTEHLVARLRPARLDGQQTLVVAGDWGVVLDTTLAASLEEMDKFTTCLHVKRMKVKIQMCLYHF